MDLKFLTLCGLAFKERWGQSIGSETERVKALIPAVTFKHVIFTSNS